LNLVKFRADKERRESKSRGFLLVDLGFEKEFRTNDSSSKECLKIERGHLGKINQV
jgi:hypothetical protein